MLAQSKSRIHISFDLWTSSNGYAICAVCAHFVASNYRNCSVSLAMKRMKGNHSGESIAQIIIATLQLYQITAQLGVFVADNADSNDTAIEAVLTELRPELSTPARRSRCLGHIINLAAKAFLFGQDTSAFERATALEDENEPLDAQVMRDAQKAWRQRGTVGKLHNVIIFIRSSPQRREAFKKVQISDSTVDSKLLSLFIYPNRYEGFLPSFCSPQMA